MATIQPYAAPNSTGEYYLDTETVSLGAMLKPLEGGDPTVDDQEYVVGALRELGVEFPEGEDEILPLDPDKFYIAFTTGEVPRGSFDAVGKFFKKGGVLLMNKKDAVKDYSIEDLRSMRDGLSHLLDMVEKKNKVAHTRFDIIKGDS